MLVNAVLALSDAEGRLVPDAEGQREPPLSDSVATCVRVKAALGDIGAEGVESLLPTKALVFPLAEGLPVLELVTPCVNVAVAQVDCVPHMDAAGVAVSPEREALPLGSGEMLLEAEIWADSELVLEKLELLEGKLVELGNKLLVSAEEAQAERLRVGSGVSVTVRVAAAGEALASAERDAEFAAEGVREVKGEALSKGLAVSKGVAVLRRLIEEVGVSSEEPEASLVPLELLEALALPVVEPTEVCVGKNVYVTEFAVLNEGLVETVAVRTAEAVGVALNEVTETVALAENVAAELWVVKAERVADTDAVEQAVVNWVRVAAADAVLQAVTVALL